MNQSGLQWNNLVSMGLTWKSKLVGLDSAGLREGLAMDWAWSLTLSVYLRGVPIMPSDLGLITQRFISQLPRMTRGCTQCMRLKWPQSFKVFVPQTLFFCGLNGEQDIQARWEERKLLRVFLVECRFLGLNLSCSRWATNQLAFDHERYVGILKIWCGHNKRVSPSLNFLLLL